MKRVSTLSYRNRIIQRKMSNSAAQPINCKAAVAWAPHDIKIENVTVAPPKAGEVRIQILANSICHTDLYTFHGQDPEGVFPCILGHEGAGVVESVGEGVTSVKPGDKVLPCFVSECREASCIFCQSPKTNLCPKIRKTMGRGLMPDETTRFTVGDKAVHHFCGCSTFSEYTVVCEISCVKISDDMPMDKASLFACALPTGLGAAWKTCDVQEGSSVAVFGLGAVGLAIIQGAAMRGASPIYAVARSDKAFESAKALGATDFVNTSELPEGQTVQAYLNEKTTWGLDYTFDATGNVDVMRSAFECAHRGWGESCVVGVAPAGAEVCTRPFQLITGRQWKGSSVGGFKSRTEIPGLVDMYLSGKLPIDEYITHELSGVERLLTAVDMMSETRKTQRVLRVVIKY